MKNPRMTPKERNLLKGAIRRVFARSELRQAVSRVHRIEHSDPNRPRVKKWAWCDLCGQVLPDYTFAVDHIDPVIPVDRTLEGMSWDELIDVKMWCEKNNLQYLCETCHTHKTKLERIARKQYKETQDGQRLNPKTNPRPAKANRKRVAS